MSNRPISRNLKLVILGLIVTVVIGTITLLLMYPRESKTQKQPRGHSEPNEPNTTIVTIVPGLGVGDYRLGMSKDELLEKLGQPKSIIWDGESYTLNNLPSSCYMYFGGIAFEIFDDSVKSIVVYGRLYKFANGLGVGDPEEKIIQAFSNNFRLREGPGKAYLTYEDEGLKFEIHQKDRTVMEITVTQSTGNQSNSDKPNSGRIIAFNEQSPGPITFPKIDRKPRPDEDTLREFKTLPKYDPVSRSNPFQIDLRCCDFTKLDLRKSIEDLWYADFNDRTIWPAPNQMFSRFDWKKVMEPGKNPGLGVRSLHRTGITGCGVRVAILYQPLLVDRREYAERVRLYKEIDLQDRTKSSGHGAAVASIAVGKTVGLAPEAELYYIAQ